MRSTHGDCFAGSIVLLGGIGAGSGGTSTGKRAESVHLLQPPAAPRRPLCLSRSRQNGYLRLWDDRDALGRGRKTDAAGNIVLRRIALLASLLDALRDPFEKLLKGSRTHVAHLENGLGNVFQNARWCVAASQGDHIGITPILKLGGGWAMIVSWVAIRHDEDERLPVTLHLCGTFVYFTIYAFHQQIYGRTQMRCSCCLQIRRRKTARSPSKVLPVELDRRK